MRSLLVWFLVAQPLLLTAYDAQPRCFKQLQTEFFRESTVIQALSLLKAPQGEWQPIYRALQRGSRQIPTIMKKRARKMRPNPLKNPFQRDAATQLFRQVSWEIFVKVLAKYPALLVRHRQEIYNFIYETELRRIETCLDQ